MSSAVSPNLLSVFLIGSCARFTGPESGKLGVNAAVVAAEHGNTHTYWVVTTPVKFGYNAILIEVDSPRRRRKKEEGRRKKEE